DADVFEWIRQFGPGYSTRINHVLRVVMSRQG
ncbi:MAG: BrnA antitoxin family protein, partial [Bryobacterales bacterium]|nr:BrnA antitoxin family protein [Bryobacterales bacterium]